MEKMKKEKTKTALLGMTLEELRQVAEQMEMPAFTAKQMARWLYVSRVNDIGAMSNAINLMMS